MSWLPSCASSRITRSASAPSGTFSTYLVLTLAPSACSISLRPESCWNVHPASLIGLTYTKPTLNGSSAAGADGTIASEGTSASTPASTLRRIQPRWMVAMPSLLSDTPPAGAVRDILHVRMVRLAERGRRVQADGGGVARDEREHENRGEVGQHGEQLRGDREAHRLRLELRQRDGAEEIRSGEQPPRLPRGEHHQRQRDPAASRRHAFGPQRRIGYREVR